MMDKQTESRPCLTCSMEDECFSDNSDKRHECEAYQQHLNEMTRLAKPRTEE